MMSISDELAGARIGRTFNQYAAGPRAPLLRTRLAAYLHARRDAPIILVGEAPGYRGARFSGIPFTSERQLTGAGPAEATATIVHRVLAELGLEDDVLLWNAVPTHPGTATTNRPPTQGEIRLGLPFVERLSVGRDVIAIGRLAANALVCPPPLAWRRSSVRVGARGVVGHGRPLTDPGERQSMAAEESHPTTRGER